jgi:hypothetical protein
MTDPVLRLEMQDTEFVITMPGTSYQVTFRRLADGPGLSASHNIRRDDRDAPVTRSEFFARAWRVANDKARELEWIAWARYQCERRLNGRPSGTAIVTPIVTPGALQLE